MEMGRIATSVKIENPSDREKKIRCDALVDTGASHMVLPSAWRDRLGDLEVARHVKLSLATQASADGIVCGPAEGRQGQHGQPQDRAAKQAARRSATAE